MRIAASLIALLVLGMRATISSASWPPIPLFQTWIWIPGIAASSFILSWAG